MANSVDPDQTAPTGGPRSSILQEVHDVCFYTYFVSNVRQLFAADDIFRCSFFLAL